MDAANVLRMVFAAAAGFLAFPADALATAPLSFPLSPPAAVQSESRSFPDCEQYLSGGGDPGAGPDCNLNLIPDDCDLLLGVDVFENRAAATGAVQTADPIAHDLHFGHAIELTRYQIDFFAGTGSGGVATVRFYSNSHDNKIKPPAGLLLTRTLALAPNATTLAEEFDPPLTLPAHIWLEVRFSSAAFGWERTTIQPTVGRSLGVIYNRFTQTSASGYLRAVVMADNDCNANATPDACDIAAGLSLDCNLSGSPDECDVLDGTSRDLNENGILDECEAGGCVCGDFNHDGNVNLADFSTFAACFGEPQITAFCPEALTFCLDMNRDGAVNLVDFVTFAAVYQLDVDGIGPPNCHFVE